MEYRSGNFDAAVADYDKVLEQFPGGNKAAAAQLKKGYSLLELGRKDAGIRELNALIQRYPHTIEATQARERLHKLGASSARAQHQSQIPVDRRLPPDQFPLLPALSLKFPSPPTPAHSVHLKL